VRFVRAGSGEIGVTVPPAAVTAIELSAVDTPNALDRVIAIGPLALEGTGTEIVAAIPSAMVLEFIPHAMHW
jgi:hypothetical protein